MVETYILIDGGIVPEPDFLKWGRWMDTHSRDVAREHLMTPGGEVLATVSTVFLGLNHRPGAGPPLVFETMVFDGPLDGAQWRYTSVAEAKDGHRRAVARVRAMSHGHR